MQKIIVILIMLISLAAVSAKDVAFLGVSTQDIPINQYINHGITDGYGILIKTVIANSAAEEAGLKNGMILRKLDNEKVYTRTQLQKMLEGKNAGDAITILAFQDNKEKKFNVKLGKRLVADHSKSPWLGVICKEAEQNENFNKEYGLLVTKLPEESPAAESGIKEDDILLEINNDKLYSVDQLKHILKTMEAGQEVKVTYWRDGKSKDLDIKLGERSIEDIFEYEIPSFPGFFDDLDIDIDLGELYSTWDIMGLPGKVHIYSFPDSTRKLLGVIVSSLTEDKLKELKLDNGVLVKSIIEKSTADAGGVKEGDIIIEVNDIEIKEKSDIGDALDSIDYDNKFNVLVIREDKPVTLEMTLKEAPEDLSNVYKFSIDDDHKIEMMFDNTDKFFFNGKSLKDSLDTYEQEEFRFEFPQKGSKGPM